MKRRKRRFSSTASATSVSGLGIMMIYRYFGTVHFYSDPRTGVHGVLEMGAGIGPFIDPADVCQSGLGKKWTPFLLMLGAFR